MRWKMLSTTLVAGLVVTGLGAAGAARAEGGHSSCGPGYTVVEEVRYRQVVKKHCRVVPEKKKVTEVVYLCEEEDYCLPGCKAPDGSHHPCGHPGCAGPRTRTILRKRIVTKEVPSTKCVVESVVETVPYTVYHKVPCPPPGPAPGPIVP
jgi:hypothetical protein